MPRVFITQKKDNLSLTRGTTCPIVAPVDTKLTLTPAEERVFDEALVRRFDTCLKDVTKRGVEGCAQWAAEQARALIDARRNAVNS